MRPRLFISSLLLLLAICSCGTTSRTPLSIGSVILATDKPFSEQVTKANTTYIIKDDFDLEGVSVNLPHASTLVFKKGSISNGTLIGDESHVELGQTKPAFNEVLLKGTFVATTFPINAYNTNKLDLFYTFLQAFSGTELYLTENYSATVFLGQADGTTPHSLHIDGKGYKLSLYSFGAYKVEDCVIKDITIEATNNITPANKWKSDKFNFGIVGEFDSSSLKLQNVTFSSETGFAYIRGFKTVEISRCKEIGSYFFVYDCDDVSFTKNSIENAAYGYYSIGKMAEDGQVKLSDNQFKNISGGGMILTGGLKYNVSITNNVLENVGGGLSEVACINIHPRGLILVKDNRIVANKGAVTMDIDAARANYYSDMTMVIVENNVIESVKEDTSLHGMALVGLAKLYVKNNTIRNQHFHFWDTPYMEFSGNTVEFSMGFEKSTEIGAMTTHETTESKHYNHIYKNNVFKIPYSKGTVHFRYQSKVPVSVTGEGNSYSIPVEFVDQNKKFKASGDIKIYR